MADTETQQQQAEACDMGPSQNKVNSGAQEEEDEEKRKKFGNRFLTDPQNVFQHNAWDNVVWDEEQESEARAITEKHLNQIMSDEQRDGLEKEADGHWNKFYSQHQNRFFKDRHWLFTEFPELYSGAATSNTSDGLTAKCDNSTKSVSQAESSEVEATTTGSSTSVDQPVKDFERKPLNFLEVGCGVGNTVFPVLNTNKNPDLMVYCCDFSSTAVQILKDHPDYDERRCCAFVWDVTEDNPEVPVQKGSLDIVIMIFVLSALSPDKMQDAISRLSSYLRPGGTLLFRDYGRYDLAQLRFKKGRCISENFYVRGDGTRVYFFTQDELDAMFSKAGFVKQENLVDRRLQVNRGKQLKMYRVWIQCKYVKKETDEEK